MNAEPGAEFAAVFAAQMARFFPDDPPATIGIALSGGGDSLALTTLLADWAKQVGTALKVVTINHDLREGSAQEAKQAGVVCRSLGLSHDIRIWKDWSGKGNLQDAARQARKTLIAQWAQDNEITTVALGHTLDDQAETVLMRLARGSGVDGLSGMTPQTRTGDLIIIRPLLTLRRGDLRQFLRARKMTWSDDPSNEDPRFDRIKARRALALLHDLGVTAEGLAATATRMTSTRHYLQGNLAAIAADMVRINDIGGVLFNRARFCALPGEMQQRLMAHALKWVATRPYRPRQSALADLISAVGSGSGRTLAGCQIVVGDNDDVHIFREYQAVKSLVCNVNSIWDHRWHCVGGAKDNMDKIHVVGEKGLAQLPDWRDIGPPRASLISSPAIWNHQELVATPFSQISGSRRICLKKGPDQFYSSIMPH